MRVEANRLSSITVPSKRTVEIAFVSLPKLFRSVVVQPVKLRFTKPSDRVVEIDYRSLILVVSDTSIRVLADGVPRILSDGEVRITS